MVQYSSDAHLGQHLSCCEYFFLFKICRQICNLESWEIVSCPWTEEGLWVCWTTTSQQPVHCALLKTSVVNLFLIIGSIWKLCWLCLILCALSYDFMHLITEVLVAWVMLLLCFWLLQCCVLGRLLHSLPIVAPVFSIHSSVNSLSPSLARVCVCVCVWRSCFGNTSIKCLKLVLSCNITLLMFRKEKKTVATRVHLKSKGETELW